MILTLLSTVAVLCAVPVIWLIFGWLAELDCQRILKAFRRTE